MKRYLWLVLAVLVPASVLVLVCIPLMGATNLFTGVGGSLISEYAWISKGVLVGNNPTYKDNSLINTDGTFIPSSSTDSYFGVDLEGTFKIGSACVSNCQAWSVILDPLLNTNSVANSSYLVAVGGYPGFYNPAGTLDTAAVGYFSFQDYQNSGTVNRLVGVGVDLTGMSGVANPPSDYWGLYIPGTDQSGGNIEGIKNNLPGVTIVGNAESMKVSARTAPKPSLLFEPITFANLGTPANGTMAYCSDCNPANCTAGASTGSFCKRQNGAWSPM